MTLTDAGKWLKKRFSEEITDKGVLTSSLAILMIIFYIISINEKTGFIPNVLARLTTIWIVFDQTYLSLLDIGKWWIGYRILKRFYPMPSIKKEFKTLKVIESDTSDSKKIEDPPISIPEDVLNEFKKATTKKFRVARSQENNEFYVKGEGFTAGYIVDIYLNRIEPEHRFQTFEVKPDGTFLGIMKIPSDTKRGMHYAWMLDRSTGQTEMAGIEVV